jgi:DNA-binding beta-propeller fold protein YncE
MRRAILLVCCCLLGSACGPRPQTQALTTPAAGTVIALLGNGQLVAIDASTGTSQWSVTLAPSAFAGSDTYLHSGHYLALSGDGRSVYALPLEDPRGGSTLAVIDTSSGQMRVSYALRGTEAVYSSLAVGSVTGRVYVFGQRSAATVVTILDPSAATVVGSWTARSMANWTAIGPVPGFFFIYQGSVSPDETRLFYSYYGGRMDLSGIDRLDLGPGGLSRCQPPHPGAACLPGWAGFQPYADRLLVTSAVDVRNGEIDDVELDGRVTHRIDLGLGPGFLEDFALDRRGSRLYAVGSCGYVGGLSSVDLVIGQATVVVPASSTQARSVICGQRSALLPTGHLVIAHVEKLLVNPNGPGRLVVVDPGNGHVLREIPTASEVLDLVVLPT